MKKDVRNGGVRRCEERMRGEEGVETRVERRDGGLVEERRGKMRQTEREEEERHSKVEMIKEDRENEEKRKSGKKRLKKDKEERNYFNGERESERE